MSGLERVREALLSRGSRVEAQGPDRFVAQCPSHDDGRPSLSVRQGDRGVLLYCFAGCASKDIAADLGLAQKDLFDRDRIDYRYTDTTGKVVRTVTRTPDKDFRQKGRTKWEQGTAPLYRLPEVEQAVSVGQPVYLVEGEKDAEALRLAGVCATTTAGGASNPHFTDLSPLKGAEVRLVPDDDPEGLKYAAKVSTLLEGVAAKASVWKVATGKDFADHYAAGFGVEDLEEVQAPALQQDREEKHGQEAPGGSEKDDDDGRRVVLTTASQVRVRPIHWLWHGRLATNEATILAGKQGKGKSTLCAYLAAQVTNGTLEGKSHGTPGVVLWVTTEDDYSHALAPRLRAAGANLDLVHFVNVRTLNGGDGPPVFPQDLRLIEETVRQTEAVLLIVDPLVSVLDPRLDSHKDHSIRQALHPIRQLAVDTGIAVLGVMHVGKTRQGDFVDRILGSTGFTAAARSVLGLVADPDDPEERKLCLGVVKTNGIAIADVPTLSLQVESAEVQADNGETAKVGKVVILGEVERTVGDLLRDQDDPESREDRDEAEHWLRSYLEERGGEALAREIRAACLKDGLSYEVLKKRKKRLGIKTSKSGMGAGWLWSLPVALTDSAGKDDDEEDREKELESVVSEVALQLVHEEPPAFAVDGEWVNTDFMCSVKDCFSVRVATVRLDGTRWNVCEVHATDPALPLLLGEVSRRLGQTS